MPQYKRIGIHISYICIYAYIHIYAYEQHMLFVQRGLLAPCIKQIQGQENSPRTQILEDKRTVWFGGCSPHSAHQRENISVTTRNGGIAGIVVHFYSCISWLPQTRAHTHTHSHTHRHTHYLQLHLVAATNTRAHTHSLTHSLSHIFT